MYLCTKDSWVMSVGVWWFWTDWWGRCVRGVGQKDGGVKAAGTCNTSVCFPTQISCFPYKVPYVHLFLSFFLFSHTHTHTINMSSSVLSQQNHSFHTMDDNRNTAIRPDNFSDTSSNSIPTTPALSKEHDLMKKDNNSTMFISEDVDPYATAEHVAAWLPLDDPPKDNASNHDILIDAIPPLPAKATRLPAPATIWKTWESPTLLPWGNDSIWMSSNKPRRFSTSLPPPLLSSMGTSATPTMITPKRRTSVTTLSSSSMPYHRRSSFPDTVLSTTDQSKKDYWQSLVSGDLDR